MNAVMLGGEIENICIRLKSGEDVYCIKGCGCNMFHKPDDTALKLYECNSCGYRFKVKND